MTAHWDNLPEQVKGRVVERKKRRPPPPPAQFRCAGVRGCGETIKTVAAAERHADGHGGCRLELVIHTTEEQP
jgi:hypothetical protein